MSHTRKSRNLYIDLPNSLPQPKAREQRRTASCWKTLRLETDCGIWVVVSELYNSRDSTKSLMHWFTSRLPSLSSCAHVVSLYSTAYTLFDDDDISIPRKVCTISRESSDKNCSRPIFIYTARHLCARTDVFITEKIKRNHYTRKLENKKKKESSMVSKVNRAYLHYLPLSLSLVQDKPISRSSSPLRLIYGCQECSREARLCS